MAVSPVWMASYSSASACAYETTRPTRRSNSRPAGLSHPIRSRSRSVRRLAESALSVVSIDFQTDSSESTCVGTPAITMLYSSGCEKCSYCW